ncbi:MAG: glycosyltransferase, partial [Anaerolineales bacterium]|nr:glycosyltransferase [Anaerolineales bacterium]
PVVCGLWAYDTPYERGWVEHLRAQGIDAFIAADWSEEDPYGSFVQAIKGMRAYVHKPVDVIHSHCQFGDVAALWLKRPFRATSLLRTVHNEREWGKRPLRRYLLTNGLYPLLFAQELGVAQTVVDNLNRRPIARLLHRQAVRAYNALDVQRFADVQVDRAALRAELGLPVDAFVVGSIGRLVEQKGYRILLTAVPAILAQLPQTHVVIVGDGEQREALQAQAQALQVNDHVHFTGPRRDVEALIQTFDLFVAPSLWEGLPTVIMESMAAGVPVVATAVSGTQELIQHQKTGYLVPAHSPEALAAAIVKFDGMETAVKHTITTNARHFVQQNFSIQAVARQHEQIYSLFHPDNPVD